jgi:hypothetical protein
MNNNLSQLQDERVIPEAWYRLPADEVLSHVKSSSKTGLSNSEALAQLPQTCKWML